MLETKIHMQKPLDAMRIIHMASGAPMSSELPISDPHPDPGLLGPDSISWRLHEEQWLITAGARAFLMQAAHPKVAQGALDHSGFAEDPFGRVYRTIQGMAVLIFGTTHEANTMARNINRLLQKRSPSDPPPISSPRRYFIPRCHCCAGHCG